MIGPFRRRPHFERDYISHVKKLSKQHGREEAMSLAVGGSVGESGFEEIGRGQVEQLIGAGLVEGMSVVDLGCGSGRTAIQIARRLPGVQYLGLDVVPALLAHARSICPANYRFVRSAALGFPVADESVDMVFAYSVFTHLYHEESFAYLQDARRILRPGGRILFSFLEFLQPNPDTWYIFDSTVAARKAGNLPHMNTFIERPVVALWAEKLAFRLVGFLSPGQTAAIFEKPK